MTAVDPAELEDTLLTHGLRLRGDTASCLSVRCPWELRLPCMDGTAEFTARRAHAEHVVSALVDDGLVELMGPAEIAELAEPVEVTW